MHRANIKNRAARKVLIKVGCRRKRGRICNVEITRMLTFSKLVSHQPSRTSHQPLSHQP